MRSKAHTTEQINETLEKQLSDTLERLHRAENQLLSLQVLNFYFIFIFILLDLHRYLFFIVIFALHLKLIVFCRENQARSSRSSTKSMQ